MSKSSNIFKTLLFVLAVFSLNGVSFAQVEATPTPTLKAKKNSLKISPTAFGASTFAVSYERYIGESVTMQLTGGIMAASKNSNKNNNTFYPYYYNNYNNGYTGYSNAKDKATGGLIDLSLKFYFAKGKSVMSGLYAGPYARYSKNTFEINDYYWNYIDNSGTSQSGISSFKYDITSYEGGALFGWQCVVKNAFVIDMYVGGGLKVSDNTSPAIYIRDDIRFDILESQDYTGIRPKAGFRIGFVF